MKKELLKSLVIGGAVGIGAGLCGILAANHAAKKAKKEIKEIRENTESDASENIEARLNRLENEVTRQDCRSLYFLVGGFILALYMSNSMDKNYRHIQEKHNGLVKHVADTFAIIGNVCEDFDTRISSMEAK